VGDMTSLAKERVASRERTLLTALLLSAPGAVVTGLATASSHSTTQLADFIRRTMELVSMFLSWWVFRQIERNVALDSAGRSRLERAAGLGVAGTMACSGLAMLIVALSRASVFEPGGRVTTGLIIAVLGLIVNGGFWWRYAALTREQYSSVIAAQQKLYRAKASVDLCVVTALAAVTVAPTHPATRYVDILGSIAVAGYLLWSGLRLAQSHLSAAGRLFHRLREHFGTIPWLPTRKDDGEEA